MAKLREREAARHRRAKVFKVGAPTMTLLRVFSGSRVILAVGCILRAVSAGLPCEMLVFYFPRHGCSQDGNARLRGWSGRCS